ncbi:flagellar basal body-associated FliL family protein [Paracoccus onubensis]|uniref:flagellar basal body-associated FliL family protein n=1 Tax=Paracoccus onubensis TaxID=1675788 RepID=UPI002731D81B|nr:flagellar basal body-associated FliL family protein [Paracoccus onubensis]MDP0927216.1 flagellar basal body-associated FliL family protein [Paracoccus onubensis]
MLKKILMILVPLIAFAAGAFGGLQLKPDKEISQAGHGGGEHGSHAEPEDEHSDSGQISRKHDGYHDANKQAAKEPPQTFTFPSQFFVPLVRRGDSDGMMIMTISLQTTHEELEQLAQQEHRLRDILLRQLLIIANTGGFDGNFTTEGRQRSLRRALLEALQKNFGENVTGILIEDIARQDT